MGCFIGKEVDLPPASEEVASFYAAMIETDHAQDNTFNKNFFEDWKKVLDVNPPVCSHVFRVFSCFRVSDSVTALKSRISACATSDLSTII